MALLTSRRLLLIAGLITFLMLFVFVKPSTQQPVIPPQPTWVYIDYSGVCPKLYYSARRVLQNCSSLNLAKDWSILTMDSYFVTELLLRDNNFRTNLPYRELNSYDTLKMIDLSRNFISELTYDLTLIECSSSCIKELNLDYNLFTKMPLLSQSCMLAIETLRLSYNRNLTNFDDPTGLGFNSNNPNKLVPGLKYLDVSYGNIQVINQNGFSILSRFPNLEYLNLMGNRIKYIYENPFLANPALRYLSFESNNLGCEIANRWIKYYFKNKLNSKNQTTYLLMIDKDGTQTTNLYYPTCFNALAGNNASIIDLDDAAFYTNIFLSTTIPNPTQITLMAGSSIDLDCQQYSLPPSNLWWSFNNRDLSRIVNSESPYQFLENFNSTESPANKTSVLRVRNIQPSMGGEYACNAFYQNIDPNPYVNINSLVFNVKVVPNPAAQAGLSPGAIAGIVIGSVLGFLLLCLLIFLILCCCCWRCGCCCFKKQTKSKGDTAFIGSNGSTSSKSSSFSSGSGSRYALNKGKRYQTQITEQEENMSGFKDPQIVRPNYTVSKSSSSSILNQNKMSMMAPDCTDNDIEHTVIMTSVNNGPCYPENCDSWGNTNAKPSINIRTSFSNIQQQDSAPMFTEIFDPYSNPANAHRYSSHDCNDETLVYNVNDNRYLTATSLSPNTMRRAKTQVYTVKHEPIDYGSTYNTNEGFLNDNLELANSHHHGNQNHNNYINQSANVHFEDDAFGMMENYESMNKANSGSHGDRRFSEMPVKHLHHHDHVDHYGNYNHSNRPMPNEYVHRTEVMVRQKQLNDNNNQSGFIKYDSDV